MKTDSKSYRNDQKSFHSGLFLIKHCTLEDAVKSINSDFT